ncbi:GNAT family N-acetyltransferase [Psychrobacter sp. AOP22-C1-C5]|uniref:GNAT family N-acetyltransferase n=1 Tax=Psychrobacter sp. AOP22-C1-C5 TaxID=3457716 RepID=UPI0040366E74
MENISTKIALLSEADHKAWLDLWQQYLAFYDTSLPLSTIEATWRNLLDNTVSIYGFGAWQDDMLVGFTHVVLHPNTWNTTDCCYLEDLYVSENVRGQGVGRALIEQVYDFAAQKNCNRVYWTTQEGNTAARKLYDAIATKTDMVQYRKNL